MSVEVIGAGLGRTGTVTFRRALERLGYAPCWHLGDLARGLDDWRRLAEGAAIDWAQLLEGYRAVGDFPICFYLRAVVDAFPQAQVVLTVTDADAWGSAVRLLRERYAAAGPDPELEEAMQALVWQRLGDLEDEPRLRRIYEDHIAAVRATVPGSRLLVYNVREGWEPLCAFLGVPVPADAFPRRTNAAVAVSG